MNSQYFDKEQVENGEILNFLKLLLEEAYGAGTHFNDIHIKTEDCGAYAIEWEQVPWSLEYGGHFAYLDEGQVIMTDKQFPDGHYELCYNEDDYQERLEMFLKENPGWVKTGYGCWTNEIENEKFREALEKYDEDILEEESCVSFDDVNGVVNSKEHHYENGIPQGE